MFKQQEKKESKQSIPVLTNCLNAYNKNDQTITYFAFTYYIALFEQFSNSEVLGIVDKSL